MKKTSAFTLIELLVVIAVIGLLAAILIPAVLGVREGSYKMTCSANLRGLGQACLTYAEEEEDRLPFITPPSGELPTGDPAYWCANIGPYLDLQPESGSYVTSAQISEANLLVCPTEMKDRAGGFRTTFKICFGMNTMLDRDANNVTDNRVFLAEIQAPSGTLHYSESLFASGKWGSSVAPNALRYSHKRDSANFLFVDGHVVSLQDGLVPKSPSGTTVQKGTNYTGINFWMGRLQ